MKTWPFTVVADNEDNAVFQITKQNGGATVEYTPEQVSSKVLKKLKESAE